MTDTGGYLGNPLLKRSGTPIEWTPEMLKEYMKCAEDPIYFAERYIKIVHVDHGFIPIKLYDYQKDIINSITHNRRVVANTSRQAGKCVNINTPIKLRNKITGEIVEMTIGDLYEQSKNKNASKAEEYKRSDWMEDSYCNGKNVSEIQEIPKSPES